MGKGVEVFNRVWINADFKCAINKRQITLCNKKIRRR
jgi:hypothetical protein